jgi:hypothetical protein
MNPMILCQIGRDREAPAVNRAAADLFPDNEKFRIVRGQPI